MKWIAKIDNNSIVFTSDFTRSSFKDWSLNNNGKYIEITPHEKISKESRGYFEAALVPTYCLWAEGLSPLDREDRKAVREMFKAEFNGKIVRGLDGKPTKIPKSTNEFGRNDFREKFIEKIVRYFEENQIPVPDPELYKKWKNVFSMENRDLTYWEWLQKNGLKPDGSSNN